MRFQIHIETCKTTHELGEDFTNSAFDCTLRLRVSSRVRSQGLFNVAMNVGGMIDQAGE